MKMTIINAIGCAVLLVLAGLQWVRHEILRQTFLDQQKTTHQITQQRDEAREKVTVLESDIADLKRAIEETQKAAQEASQQALQREDALKEAAGASIALKTERDTFLAERDALKARTTEWENAVKERDTTITRLNADLVALRKKLDEAIVQLKKAGAR